MKYQAILLFLTVLCLLSCGGTPVLAETINLTLVPSVIKIIAKPGSSATFHYTLRNNGDPVLAKVFILPFKPSDNLGHITLDKDQKAPVKFTIKNQSTDLSVPFLLKSNAVQDIAVSMQIDQATLQKDYYFTLLTETTPFPASEGETTLQVISRVGSNLLLTVTSDGRTEKKASIALLSIIPQKPLLFKTSLYDTFQKIPFVLSISNDGRNFINPQITLAVKGWNIQKKYLLSSPVVLSNSQRLLNDSMSGLFIGTYTVSASLTNGIGAQTVTTTTTFTAFPFLLVLALLLVILFYLLLRKKAENSHL